MTDWIGVPPSKDPDGPKRCPTCGQKLPPGNEFLGEFLGMKCCPECGTELPSEGEGCLDVAIQPRKCPKCGWYWGR